MNENNGAIRDASVLGVPKMLILGLQHMFAMFGATILVPILVNSYFGEDVLHVQVTLICAGVGTLFFHLCSKFKVPAFLGSSFAFLGGFATIANLDTGVFADMFRIFVIFRRFPKHYISDWIPFQHRIKQFSDFIVLPYKRTLKIRQTDSSILNIS